VPARQRDRAYQARQRRRRVNLKFPLAFFLVRSRLARDRVILRQRKSTASTFEHPTLKIAGFVKLKRKRAASISRGEVSLKIAGCRIY
jgi:hypothetical protein